MACAPTVASIRAGGLSSLSRTRTSFARKPTRGVVRSTSAVARCEIQKTERIASLTQASLVGTMVALSPSAAWAEEAVQRAPPSLNPLAGVSTGEAIILLAPVTLYAVFSVLRTVNPTLKFGDFMFFLVAAGIFGNIFAILVLKQRLF